MKLFGDRIRRWLRPRAVRTAGAPAQVISVNHHWILLHLRELGSVAEQRRLWLADGTETHGQVSSFVEAYCGLFDDSVLGEVLDSSGTEFGLEIDAILRGIDDLLSAIDEDRSQEEIIADPAMAEVRQLASDAFCRIMSMRC